MRDARWIQKLLAQPPRAWPLRLLRLCAKKNSANGGAEETVSRKDAKDAKEQPWVTVNDSSWVMYIIIKMASHPLPLYQPLYSPHTPSV
jgi:hypothetical protein